VFVVLYVYTQTLFFSAVFHSFFSVVAPHREESLAFSLEAVLPQSDFFLRDSLRDRRDRKGEERAAIPAKKR
jgi:hypothetical protein